MLTIGVDPHKGTHSAVAVDQVGVELSSRTERAESGGFGALLLWARALADGDRVWVIEDCRHVSGPFERFLLESRRDCRAAPATADGRRPSERSSAREV